MVLSENLRKLFGKREKQNAENRDCTIPWNNKILYLVSILFFLTFTGQCLAFLEKQVQLIKKKMSDT